MKVATLVALLSQFGDDTDVVFAYDSGDHWRYQVAGEVHTVELGRTVYSDYHNMYKVVDQEDTEYEDDNGDLHENVPLRKVVILG